ncbi:hypothetical protein TUBRATIS_13360 [Tubulinosema ratisbonensis]|uniref:Uncharacterized protein n=1 Tax=Tubulinosema ratisbonensis TaxID=291195 RepID=A0A437ALU5_9MICR|nr:hypothetical protein TUBRATIS_13360 [Tubulinosema ratisbonensis]
MILLIFLMQLQCSWSGPNNYTTNSRVYLTNLTPIMCIESLRIIPVMQLYQVPQFNQTNHVSQQAINNPMYNAPNYCVNQVDIVQEQDKLKCFNAFNEHPNIVPELLDPALKKPIDLRFLPVFKKNLIEIIEKKRHFYKKTECDYNSNTIIEFISAKLGYDVIQICGFLVFFNFKTIGFSNLSVNASNDPIDLFQEESKNLLVSISDLESALEKWLELNIKFKTPIEAYRKLKRLYKRSLNENSSNGKAKVKYFTKDIKYQLKTIFDNKD